MKDRTCSRRHSSAYRSEGGRLICPMCREDRGPAPALAEPAPLVEAPISVESSAAEVQASIESPAVDVRVQAESMNQASPVSSTMEFTIPDSGVSPPIVRKVDRKTVGSVRTKKA